jgi:hypothetical protein
VTKAPAAADLVRVMPILPPGGTGTMLSHEAWIAGKLTGASHRRSEQWATKCWHVDCGDPKAGRIVSVDLTAELAQYAADRHRAQHAPAD